jgi:hypothetical protein
MNNVHRHSFLWETQKQKTAHCYLSMGSLLFLVNMLAGTWRMDISLGLYITTKRRSIARLTNENVWCQRHFFSHTRKMGSHWHLSFVVSSESAAAVQDVSTNGALAFLRSWLPTLILFHSSIVQVLKLTPMGEPPTHAQWHSSLVTASFEFQNS